MGILRPKIQLLNDDYKQKIFREAKQILENQGVFVENEEAIELLNGESVDNKDQTFFLPPDLVDKCLQTVPNEIKLYNREGDAFLSLRNDEIHYDPGSAAIFLLDEDTGEIRDPVQRDFIRFTKIVDQLPNIEAQSTALVCSDLPKEIQDWHRLFIALKHCNKPVVTGTFRKESFAIMHELLLACRNSEKDLANKPLAIFDACPSPPLMWSDLTTQSVIDAARSMLPSELISMGMAGATAPVTLLGSVTQHCAETMSGIVIAQLARKNAPVIWGGSPSMLDMKYGTTPMGAIETMMIDVCNAQLGKFLGLPTHAYMSLSDSKIPDAQAGLESGFGALLAGLVGINVVSGPGMLDFESCQSIEKLLIDHEIIGMVKRLVKGIDDHGSPFAADILKDYEDKEELLSHPSTLKYFRKEFFFPSPIINRMTGEEWKKKERSSARKRARNQIDLLLKKPPTSVIDDSLASELDKISTENL